MLATADTDDTDHGPREGRRGTERLCALTREVKPIGELIRFVAAPDGAIVPDLKRRLPGRGVWVTATRHAVDEAARRNLFARSLKREVRAPRDLGAALERQLESAALAALGIAHKAGRVAIGFGRTESALAAPDPVVAILYASDGAADGARKIAAAAAKRQSGENPAEIPVISAFTSVQLDLALGRSNVVHAALLAGPASNGFLARCQSLERFRTVDPGGRGTG
ncbi:MAG: RNA-binding protein [Alphaproteobacteria bacterium]|nr:MAG: RNA-binding protein [Alphaproteobacteria bacterium]